MSYDHKAIDAKWQKRWEDAGLFNAKDDDAREKFYLLVEFPYPSGAGLHVGHPRSYTALDTIARKKRMEGKNVLFPMGWDAFGLPAENYAIKTGNHPATFTQTNIDTFRRQLKSMGFSFDWSREFSTTDPAYYKWTQWMFLQFFKAGLAYKAEVAINWCPKDKCGLANEEVIGGACERCGTPVEKRLKSQWMIAITKYADRLIDDLATVDYLPKIKKQQEDWIGRSEGAEIDFALCHPSSHIVISSAARDLIDGVPPIVGMTEKITVFTTRPDTIFGVTYVVLAPEHPLVASLTTDEQRESVDAYVAASTKKTDIERGDDTKEKTGVFTGSFVTNPANGEKVPVWVADYVLGHYGTGAVMAVPQHDERDCAFAEKFGLPIVDAPLLSFDEAVTKTGGKKTVQYKLRDWVFSRQRYWGEPIPLVDCGACGWVAVSDADLPVELPNVEKYEPTDDGESPLATIDSFVNTKCPQCGGDAKRETDTMPNWAGSSWYFLRYIDPKNDTAFASKELLKQWMPVDLYNGGMEHTTLHLLYSRFWNKFLFDQGLVPTSEPYARRHSHGLIMSDDGTKMSKSKGNVVNPDDIVGEHGADTFRVYILFMGPFEEPVPWSSNGVIGVRRFLDRVMRMEELVKSEKRPEGVPSEVEGAQVKSPEVIRALHKMIAKVTKDIDGFSFNTAVAAMMIFVNEVYVAGSIDKNSLATFVKVFAPFAPHVANELWEKLCMDGFAEAQPWPVADASLAADDELNIAVQVNGKLRGTVTVPADIDEATLIATAKESPTVAKYLVSEPTRTIVVKGRMVNFVL
ncbi:MAG: class I tRNA ligase family protein [Patescibacteria group bacterium]